jgi:uncharacterized phage protein (TIGR02220 family)
MKWFKHLTASGHDPDIGEVIDKFGFEGYYLFFRTLEIMATEFKIETPGENIFNFSWFLGEFSRKIKRKKVIEFLEFTTKKGRITYSLNGDSIYLKCNKLKVHTDEYTQKLIKQKSGFTPDLIQKKSKENPSHRIRIKNKNKEVSKDTYKELRKKIIEYLNEKTNKKYEPDSKETIDFINGRINDKKNPATWETFKHVIDVKVSQWLGAEDEKWLRPSTLFRPSNFENYRNEKAVVVKKKESWPEWSDRKEAEKKEREKQIPSLKKKHKEYLRKEMKKHGWTEESEINYYEVLKESDFVRMELSKIEEQQEMKNDKPA